MRVLLVRELLCAMAEHHRRSSTRRCTGIASSTVVYTASRALAFQNDLSPRGTVALKRICDDHPRHILQTFQQLAEELIRGFLSLRLWTSRMSTTSPS